MESERAIDLRPDRQRRTVLELTVLGAILAVGVSELLSRSVRHFWQTHPMLAALASSAVIVAFTVLVVDGIVERRNARRWRRVAQTGYRELSTTAFEALQAIGTELGVDATDLDAVKARVSDALRDPEEGTTLMLVLGERNKILGQAVAQWATVMLENAELAEALDHFARIREGLQGVAREYYFGARDADWELRAEDAFQAFIGEFAMFHVRRKVALGELTEEDLAIISTTDG